MIEDPRPSWRIAIDYIICYILWVAVGALGFWTIFLIRENLVDLAVYARVNPWFPRLVERWGLFVLGMVWIFCIFLIEGYFRTGAEKQIFWPRFVRIASILVVIAGLSLGLRYLF